MLKTPAAMVHGELSAAGASTTAVPAGAGGAGGLIGGLPGVAAALAAGRGVAANFRTSAAFAAASFACSRACVCSGPVSLLAAAVYELAASAQRSSSTAMAPCMAKARPATTGSLLRAAMAKALRASSALFNSLADRPTMYAACWRNAWSVDWDCTSLEIRRHSAYLLAS